MEVFQWYHHELIVSIVGTSNWGLDTLFYVTLSMAQTKSKSPKKLINASTEAFLVVLYDNCRNKWMTQFKFRADKEKKLHAERQKPRKVVTDAKPKPLEADEEQPGHPEPDDEAYFSQARYQAIQGEKPTRVKAKYTEAESGQQEFDGWTVEGREAYLKYMKAIKKSHVEGNWNKSEEGSMAWLEERCLHNLRLIHNKVGSNADDEKRLKNKRRRKKKDLEDETEDAPAKSRKVVTVVEGDEEDWD